MRKSDKEAIILAATVMRDTCISKDDCYACELSIDGYCLFNGFPGNYDIDLIKKRLLGVVEDAKERESE